MLIQKLTKNNFNKNILIENFQNEDWFSINNLDIYLEDSFLSFQYNNVGIICTSIIESYRSWLYILAVKKEFHRNGIGTKLLNHTIDILKSKDYKFIVVDVDPYSESVEFYSKNNFKSTSIIENWFGINNNGMLMYRNL